MGLDRSSLRKEEVSVPHYSHQWECTRAKGYAVHLFYQSVIFCYDTHKFLNLSSSVQKFHLLQQHTTTTTTTTKPKSQKFLGSAMDPQVCKSCISCSY